MAPGSDPTSDQVGGLAPEKGTSARLADGFDAKDLLADAVRGDHDRLDCHQRTGVAGGAVAGLAGLSGHHGWTLIGLASTPGGSVGRFDSVEEAQPRPAYAYLYTDGSSCRQSRPYELGGRESWGSGRASPAFPRDGNP